MGQSVRPAVKVCGGCGRPVDDSMECGKLYWCEWAYRKAPVRIKRRPLWKAPPVPPLARSRELTGRGLFDSSAS